MKTRRRSGRGAAALTATLFLLQGCATVIKGTHQKIPVTSVPAGAIVLVDGRDAGMTPLILKLSKKRPAVIRIEKEGYNPHEIRVTRSKPNLHTAIGGNSVLIFVVGTFLVLPILAHNESHDYRVSLPVAFVLSTAALIGVDFATGSPYSLTPESFDITLTPAGRDPRVDVTWVEGARLNDIKWLRVRAAGVR